MNSPLLFLSRLLGLLQGRDRVAGLVIEQERVRFAEFRSTAKTRRGRHRVLVEEGAVHLPPNTIREGVLAQPLALVQAIEELRRKGTPHNLTARNVVASVPIVHLVGRTVSLPLAVHPDEVDSALRLEMEHLLPFPLDEAYFDWQALPSVASDASLTKIFLVAAARKNEVNPYREALSRAGINVVALEPLTMSIVRGIEERVGVTYVALVYPETLLAAGMDEKGHPRFFHHRSIPKLPGQSALPQEWEARAAAIASELTSFIRFFRAEVGGKEQELVADGFFGEATLPALRGLSESLHLSVRIEQDSHVLSRAAARGAALRGMISRSDDRLVSLMPVGTEEAYETRRREFFVKSAVRVVIASVAISVALFAAAAGYLRTVESGAHNQMQNQPPIPPETLQQVDRVNADIGQALVLLDLPRTPERLPAAVESALPKGVTLSSVVLDTQKAMNTRVEVAVLAENLAALEAYRDILQKEFSTESLGIPNELFLKPDEPARHTFVFLLKPDFH